MNCIKKSDIFTKVKELILENNLENIIKLSSDDVLLINKNIKTKFMSAIDFCDSTKELYKTNKYYEFVRDFGGDVIQNTVFEDDDLVFYSHFVNDSKEANDEVEHQIKCAITEFFFNYKKDDITYRNEEILSKYMIDEVSDKIKPYELELLSRIGCLYNDITDISDDLVDYMAKTKDKSHVKDKFNMIDKMLSNIVILLSNWAKILGCNVDEISDYDKMKLLYNKGFIPNYEKDLRKVLNLKNIKNALIKFSNEKEDLFIKSLEYDDGDLKADCSIKKLLKNDLSYGLPSIDEIFNSNKGKVKIKK